MSALNTVTYVGEFRHSIDAKGRVVIPSQWRPRMDSDENNFLAFPSLTERSVTVYPPKMSAQLHERMAQISMGDQAGQRAIRRIMSKAHTFACDKQGRINLNDKLVEFANLQKSVVLLGGFSKFTIYDEALYDQLLDDDAADDAEDLATTAQSFGL